MDDPAIVTTAIVLTAVEEGLSRSTMVHRDRFFRLLSGHDDYTPEELTEQRFCWMVQIGNSTIIEVFAILAHALCVVLFRPHRFVFNFGYGSTEEAGVVLSVVLVNTLLELCGELLTDHMALHAEMESGVVADRYFGFVTAAWGHVGRNFGQLLCALGIVLWTFSRVPSAAFCDSPDPCSCLDDADGGRRGTNFAIYLEACTVCKPPSTQKQSH